MGAPVVVVEGPGDAFTRALRELGGAGWHVTEGFGADAGARPGSDLRAVRAGVVRSPEDAAAALLAVLSGDGAVIHGCATREVLDRLLDDLRHVGPVEHRTAAAANATPEPAIDSEARAILVLLAEGRTLGDAAVALGLSRRTADRRLACARTALGTGRTVEAIARARRLGWLG